MKNFIKHKKIIIELGSGNGCLKKIINSDKIIITDIVKYQWIDKKLDMIKLNLNKNYINKVDIFIINHSLHHYPNPSLTLAKMSKFLKKGGYILINEPETSFFLKLIQYILDDESWSLKDDVFKKKNLFKSNNPWFSNTAIAQLLFKNEKKFLRHFPEYEIKKNSLSEFFIFLNSSGLNTNFVHIKLNNFFLNCFDLIDKLLILFFPNVFALNRSVVLKKK